MRRWLEPYRLYELSDVHQSTPHPPHLPGLLPRGSRFLKALTDEDRRGFQNSWHVANFFSVVEHQTWPVASQIFEKASSLQSTWKWDNGPKRKMLY